MLKHRLTSLPPICPWAGCMVGGRDSPHEVFDPCVRWDLGLDRIRSFCVVVVVSSRCRVVVLSRCRVVVSKMDLSEENVPVLVPYIQKCTFIEVS